jgi:hypothetical protein
MTLCRARSFELHIGDPAAELGRMAAYGTLTRALLETDADGEPLDGRLIAACAVDTYALLGLLGADEFADQELVDRGLRGRQGRNHNHPKNTAERSHTSERH